MNSPSLDSGEELPHVNTQLFGILDEENRIKLWAEKSFKVPRDGPVPTMDGFLPGLASHFSTNFRRWGHSRVPTTWRRCLDRLDAAGLTWKV
jgi:phospholipase C